jgi:hypothetical protein
MEMKRLPALPAVAALVALATGCTATTGSEQPSPRGQEAAGATEPGSARLKVEMNHCFVEPVTFDGRQWNVPFKKQFGWGGMEPKHWQGAGVMVRVAENTARFNDDGGAAVVFKPVDDPAVRPVEKAVCD